MSKRKAPADKPAAEEPLPNFQITVGQLLLALRATAPCASKDEERPHLCLIRFTVDLEKLQLELGATNGHCMARVYGQLRTCSHSQWFAIDESFVPAITKMLARIDVEHRFEVDCTITVAKDSVRFATKDLQVVTARASDQLEFPALEKVVPPIRKDGQPSTYEVLVDPDLFGKLLKCASHLSECIYWRQPAAPIDPIRIDVSNPTTGVTGTFVGMPKRLEDKV